MWGLVPNDDIESNVQGFAIFSQETLLWDWHLLSPSQSDGIDVG